MGHGTGRTTPWGRIVDVGKRAVAIAATNSKNRMIERAILGYLVIASLAMAAYIRWEIVGRHEATTRRSATR